MDWWHKLWNSASDLRKPPEKQPRGKFKPREKDKTYTWEEIAEIMKKGQQEADKDDRTIRNDGRFRKPEFVNPKPIPSPLPEVANKQREYRVYIFNTKAEYLKRRQYWWDEQMNKSAVCNRCRRSRELTLDHIVPQQILIMFGFDTERMWDEENYQVLCRFCNTFKGNRLDFNNPLTKPLIIKYLALIEDLPKEQ